MQPALGRLGAGVLASLPLEGVPWQEWGQACARQGQPEDPGTFTPFSSHAGPAGPL